MRTRSERDDPILVIVAFPFQLTIVLFKALLSLPLILVVVSFYLVWALSRPGERKGASKWARRLINKVLHT